MVSEWSQSPRKFKRTSDASAYYMSKLKEAIAIYESKFQMQNIILAHCLAQIAFIQAWVGKVGGGLRESLGSLQARMKEVEDILGLAESGK